MVPLYSNFPPIIIGLNGRMLEPGNKVINLLVFCLQTLQSAFQVISLCVGFIVQRLDVQGRNNEDTF